MRRLTVLGVVLAVLAGGGWWLMKTERGRRAQFVIGGALEDLGYRMQDHLESFDLEHEHDVTPEQVFQEVLKQNRLSAAVREHFPRTPRHPLVALVVCMDSRLDTNELLGDTRHYYYVVRTAGSVLSEREEEMLELAVDNGVKLIVLTTHSDCAAEMVAASAVKRKKYPALAQAVDERDRRVKELTARPALAERVAKGELAIKLMDIDTLTERMMEHQPADGAGPSPAPSPGKDGQP